MAEISTNISNRQRLDYVDVAKGGAMLLILLGHLMTTSTMCKLSLYSFHLPVFFLLSGFFLKDKQFKMFIKSRFIALMVPYFLFSLLYGKLDLKTIPYLLYCSHQSLQLGKTNGMMWFLPCLFFASIVAWGVIRISKEKVSWIFIAAFLLLAAGFFAHYMAFDFFKLALIKKYGFPLAFDVVLLASAFMLVGKGLFISGFCQFLRNLKPWKLAFISLIMLVTILNAIYNVEGEYPQVASGRLGNWFIFFAVSVVAFIGFLALSILITNVFPNMIKKALLWVGINSMQIYLVHKILYVPLRSHVCPPGSGVMMLLLAFVIMVIFSVLASMFVNRYTPYLLGKFNK